jgi:hypothetical protein
MSTSDKGYQSVIHGLDGVCESFRTLVDQVNFEQIRDNVAKVSTQSNSQKEMLERLKEKIETLMEKNNLLESKNTALTILYEVSTQSNSQKEMLERLREKIETLMAKNTALTILYQKSIFLKEEDAIPYASRSSGTEDENGSEEEIEEKPIRSMSNGEDVEAETICQVIDDVLCKIEDKAFDEEIQAETIRQVIDDILRQIEDKAFEEIKKHRLRTRIFGDLKEIGKLGLRKQVIDDILRQIEDNIFVESNLVNPQFKSRDLNKTNQLLSEEFLHDLILMFAKRPTTEPFTTPDGYPIQMKCHSWWTDDEHNFKQKMIFFMESLSDPYLNIRDPIEESLWSPVEPSEFTRLTDLKIAFEDGEALESEGGGEDEDEKGLQIWNADLDQIKTIVDYIGECFFLTEDIAGLKKRKFKNEFNVVRGDDFTWENLKKSFEVIVHNFENRKLTQFEPQGGSKFQTRLGEDPSWGSDSVEDYKTKTETYLRTKGFSRRLQAP